MKEKILVTGGTGYIGSHTPVKLQEAEFEGQTKAKLGNTEIRTLVSNMVYSKLMEFFEENPGVAKAIFCLLYTSDAADE
mgnify:CR=1 FL=1